MALILPLGRAHTSQKPGLCKGLYTLLPDTEGRNLAHSGASQRWGPRGWGSGRNEAVAKPSKGAVTCWVRESHQALGRKQKQKAGLFIFLAWDRRSGIPWLSIDRSLLAPWNAALAAAMEGTPCTREAPPLNA